MQSSLLVMRVYLLRSVREGKSVAYKLLRAALVVEVYARPVERDRAAHDGDGNPDGEDALPEAHRLALTTAGWRRPSRKRRPRGDSKPKPPFSPPEIRSR